MRTIYRKAVFLCSVFLWALGSVAFPAEPALKWTFTASSGLYPPPLTADLLEYSGLETMVIETDARLVRCVNAQGQAVWEHPLGSSGRITARPALRRTPDLGAAELLIATRAGVVVCLDAATGEERWRSEAGAVSSGGTLWADLDGDSREEAVVGTDENGVAALSADGEPVWTYTGEDESGSITLSGPLAAADVDRDDTPEIFALDRRGPLCLDARGDLRWRVQIGSRFLGGPVIADADADDMFEVYCVAAQEPALAVFDAETGDPLRTISLRAAPDILSANGLAVGDLDGDGRAEIIVGDGAGHVYAIAADGALLWTFLLAKPTHSAISLGDVDGDGGVDVLVAAGDRTLYCLDRAGEKQWQYQAGMPLIHAPTITDVDQDGLTDVLFGGYDGLLRCLNTRGRYVTPLIPWPMAGHDAARSAAFHQGAVSEIEWVFETQSLLRNGGFDTPAETAPTESGEAVPVEGTTIKPRGWRTEALADDDWRQDTETKLGGAASIQVTPRQDRLILCSSEVAVVATLRSVTGLAMAKGPGAAGVSARWRGNHGVLREDAFTAGSTNDAGWRRFNLPETSPPLGARWISLVLITEAAGSEPTWWDETQLTGEFQHAPEAGVFINQVGYEPFAAKRFTAWSNFPAAGARFALTNSAGQTVYEASLSPAVRILGAGSRDWGRYYYRGDFTEFNTKGTYHLIVSMDQMTVRSPDFEIAADLLWKRTFDPAWQCFTHHRCGGKAPGYHEACHLDDTHDGLSLAGGWHDGGAYDRRYTPRCVWELALTAAVVKWRLDVAGTNTPGAGGLLDEILWGADYLVRAIRPDGSAYPVLLSDPEYWGAPEKETDNLPDTGDERRPDPEADGDPSLHAAALARTARLVEDNAAYIEAAKRGLQWALDHDRRGPLQFCAAMDLFVLTGEESYGKVAQELFGDPGKETVESYIDYDNAFASLASFTMATWLIDQAKIIVERAAQNPFGVYVANEDGKNVFFTSAGAISGEHALDAAHSTHILMAAALVAQAYRFTPTPEFQAFIYDQLNWILGNNPYGISLMEGVGAAFAPTYHHRYAFGGVARGAVPGAICNGISYAIEDGLPVDQPWFDMTGLDVPEVRTNGCSLTNNAYYISTLANLKRIRFSEGLKLK